MALDKGRLGNLNFQNQMPSKIPRAGLTALVRELSYAIRNGESLPGRWQTKANTKSRQQRDQLVDHRQIRVSIAHDKRQVGIETNPLI